MKILFLIASLRGGGAERVAATLCNHWVKTGHEVVLVTFDTPENDFYVSDNKIKRYSLKCFKTSKSKLEKVYSNLNRIWRLRKIVRYEKPTVILSFMDVANILALLSCLFINVPVIISERTYPPYFNNNNSFDKIRKFIYKFAAAFVAQTSNVEKWASNFLTKQNIAVIGNPVDIKNIATTKVRENVVLAVGRLSPEKGFDMLIQAFAQMHADYPNWRLKIVGEGTERQNLQNQINALKLDHKISLPGHTTNPQIEYANSKIFVLSSRVEGFPNVLIEAMTHGIAVTSFDCNSGPADIVTHEVDGLLVADNQVAALAAAMSRLAVDDVLRVKLGAEALKVRDRYALDHISQQWLDLFARVTSKHATKNI